MVHTWGQWMFRLLALGILIHTSLCLKAASPGQNDQGKQKVSVIADNKELQEVFRNLKQQTGLTFFYSETLINDKERVTINMVNKTLDEVLQKVLGSRGFVWEYTDNVVGIKKSERHRSSRSVDVTSDTSVTSQSITGKVVSPDGTAIPGATVVIKGTRHGTTTDSEGNFTLPKDTKNDMLIISSIGYDPREIPIRGKSILVKLNIAVSKLDETVVIAYGNSTRRELTGSISRVTAEEIRKQPVSNPLAALQGRMPGIIITQNTGVPGGAFTVQIRGQNSIANGNNPLYIIDGVPFTSDKLGSIRSTPITIGGNPLSAINPSDIESIEVLKDADATAIYGSRGANGVVLITTKKGRVGKNQFDVNFYTGGGAVSKRMKLLDTKQYLSMRHEALQNDGVNPGDVNADNDLLKWDTARYTDWQKELLGGTAKITNLQASLSGGTETTQFLFGGGYARETTVFPGEFKDQKISSHFNITHTSLDKKFKATITASYLSENNNIFYQDLTNLALTLAPNAPALYDESGKLNWASSTWRNPLAYQRQKFQANTDNLLSNAILSYELIPGLYIKASAGYNKIEMDELTTTPKSYFNPAITTIKGSSTFGNSNVRTWILEPQAEFKRSIGKGNLNILIGATFQESLKKSELLLASGYTSDDLIEDIKSAATVTVDNSNYTQYRYNAFFGRIHYDWKVKYILNLTGRRDGSSRFGPGKQFANFGSIGAGWIFSEENFVKNSLPFLSYGKFRASFGTTGNDQITDYQYLSTYGSTSFPYNGVIGAYALRLFNPEYGWETVKKLESAMELGFLKDKILLTLGYYRNRTSNQLIGYPLPGITGFTSIQSNLPAVVENRGWEIEVNTINVKKNHFSWTTSLNITVPSNKLISYPNIETSPYAYQYAIGHPLTILLGYSYAGVNPQTGLHEFRDNKTGQQTTVPIFPDDLHPSKNVGQQYYGGLQNSFQFKGFELNFLFQFVKQTGYSYFKGNGIIPGMQGNQPADVLERWKTVGDQAKFQPFTQDYNSIADNYFNFQGSDGVIVDASFIRLKNLSFSYAIDTKLIQKMKLSQARVYVQGQNLLTFTKYDGLDPENQSNVNLPPLRVLTAGVQFTF